MKKYIIIVSVVILYVLVILTGNLFIGNKTYLIINPKIRWEYKSGKWSKMEPSKKVLGKFDLYDMSTFKKSGSYDLMYDGTVKVKYKKDFEDTSNDSIYAVKGNIKFIDYKKDTVLTNSEQSQFLAGTKLKLDGIISLRKVIIDLDNDKEKETLYFVNNYEFLEDELPTYYSGVYIYDNGNYDKIIEKSSKTGFRNFYGIFSIIDFKNDGKYEIIISDAGINRSHDSDEYYMYGLEDNKYVELINIK